MTDARKSPFDHAAPRPWFVVGLPWNQYEPWINSGSDDPHAGQFVCDLDDPSADPATETSFHRKQANAELICRAVNEYEALLAVERVLTDARPLLGLSVSNSLGARADKALAALAEARRGT